MKKLVLAASLTFALPVAAMAEGHMSPSSDLGLRFGTGASIIGATVEGSYRFSDRLAVRGMYGKGSFDYNETNSGNDYEAEFDLGGSGVFIDFYPTDGALRMSAGALMMDYDMVASTTGSFTTGGTTYTSTVEGEGNFKNDISPTVSFGFEKSLFKTPLMLNADIGAAYTGGYETSFRDPDGNIPQSDIDAETKNFSDTLNDLKIMPFVKVGVSFAF